ncbi:MAG: ATPase domain-containing protein [Nanoarchaeota archaeon]
MKNIFDRIPRRSAILILGPPMAHKKDLLYKLILYGFKKKEAVLFVTTDSFPNDIEAELGRNNVSYKQYEKQGNLKFIDCYSAQAQDVLSITSSVVKVPGPLALNEISVAMSEIESGFYKKNKVHKIIFQSLSTLLMYSRPEAIERFVQVIVARTKNAGGSIFFTIEEGMHDERILISLEHLMDGIIAVKGKKPVLKLR